MVKRYEPEPEPVEPSQHIELAENNHDASTNDAFAESYQQQAENRRSLLREGQELAGPMKDVSGEQHIVAPDDIVAILPHPEKAAWRTIVFNKKTGKAAIVVSVAGLVAGAAWLRQRSKPSD